MKKFNVFLVFLGIAMLNSCTPDATQPDLASKLKTFISGGVTYADGVLETVMLNNASTSGFYPQYENHGLFYNSSGNTVQANTVKLNNNTISWNSSRGYYSTSSVSYNTFHVWDITGNSDVPTFKDSVLAPASFSISSPTLFQSDSISKSGGNIVTWSSPGTDSVVIRFQYEAGMSKIIDTTITTSNYTYTQVTVPNNGSYTIPSGLLSSFPNKGVILTAVIAFRTKNITVSSKAIALRVASIAAVEAFIRN